jgi:HK97 gp10 family phage protein
MESGPSWRWYGQEFKAKVQRHVGANLDAAAIFLTNDIKNSFGDSGVTGTRSGATQSQRAANRSEPWGPPNVDSGHLRKNTGWDRHGNMRRRIGTGIGDKESVGYAMWLEFGTRKMQPRPFLRPALSRNADKLRKMIGRPMR